MNDTCCCCCCLFICLFFVWTENVSVTPQQNICCNIQQASCGWRAHFFNLKSRFFSKQASDWLEYMTLMLTFNQLLLVVVDEVTKTWPLSPPAASVWWTERTALSAYHPVWRAERTSVTLCEGQREHLSPCMKDREDTYHWPCVEDRENTYHPVWRTERTHITDPVWKIEHLSPCVKDRENTHYPVWQTERIPITVYERQREHWLPPVWRTERTPITVWDEQREH